MWWQDLRVHVHFSHFSTLEPRHTWKGPQGGQQMPTSRDADEMAQRRERTGHTYRLTSHEIRLSLGPPVSSPETWGCQHQRRTPATAGMDMMQQPLGQKTASVKLPLKTLPEKRLALAAPEMRDQQGHYDEASWKNESFTESNALYTGCCLLLRGSGIKQDEGDTGGRHSPTQLTPHCPNSGISCCWKTRTLQGLTTVTSCYDPCYSTSHYSTSNMPLSNRAKKHTLSLQGSDQKLRNISQEGVGHGPTAETGATDGMVCKGKHVCTW